MKRNYLFSALASGLVVLSACSNEEGLVPGGDPANESKQQIVLQVANTGDGIQSRGGRPLYGSEAKQSIENVKVVICGADNKVAYVTTVEEWNTTGSTAYTTGGHGREKTIEIPTDNKLAAGNYTVYAFGYHSNSDYDLDDAIANVSKDGKFDPNTVLSFKEDATNKIGEEIFAGSLALTVKDGVGFKTPVVLNRQVAGTFGYFEAIPYVEGAAKLELVAYQRNTQLVLGQFGNFDLLNNGKDNSSHINYVINGTTAATDNVVYSINLTDWFNEVKDANNDGLIDVEDNWKTPDKYNNNANFKEGSVFGGEFLIPFAKGLNATDKTFVLQLTKEDGTSVLRSWTVKLPNSDSQLSKHTLWTWGGTAFASAENSQDNVTTYNVVRNHLYGIGHKGHDKDPGTDPDPDPDEPEPLNKKQELTLRVNDNWEVIHKMEVEED